MASKIFPAFVFYGKKKMILWVAKIMSFLLSMWTNLPQLTKDQIIESIVEKFTELFREFYRFYMNSKENSGAKND